jgi:alkylhydroperoxidase/carboxymuconolactone decarboxylase family protein YurZ
MGRVLDDFQKLDEYDPRLLEGLVAVRRACIPGSKDPEPAIPMKYKELMMVAVETAVGRGEKGKSHARKAVRAGASIKEVQEALALCIYLTGMATWVDSGKYCLKAAEEETQRLARGEEFSWTAEVKDGDN